MNINILDEKSFQEIFNSHYKSLCAYVNSYLKDPDSSEDIIQGMFVDIWQKKAKLNIIENPKAYLYRTAYNRLQNHFRHQKYKENYCKETALHSSFSNNTEHTIAYNEANSSLSIALQQMPQRCREVFELSRFSELPHKEIADILGISVKTVENQITKALKITREVLINRGTMSH